jgi:hypothetical protein
MSARRILYGVLFTAVLSLGYGCGVRVIKATASTPSPTLYAKLNDSTVRIDVFEVLDQRCSSIQGKRDFCVENLHKSLGDGLMKTLGAFMKPGSKDSSNFVADFRLLEFTQTPSQRDPNAVVVSMRWKFALKRTADNQNVIDIDETTVAPQEVARADLATPTVMSMINTIFERIGAELGKQDLSGQPPAAPPPPAPEPAPPAQVCVPNATQECTGPGACKGGQACLPDGSGFSECDCGKKKKSGSKSAPAPVPPAEPAPSEPTP